MTASEAAGLISKTEPIRAMDYIRVDQIGGFGDRSGWLLTRNGDLVNVWYYDEYDDQSPRPELEREFTISGLEDAIKWLETKKSLKTGEYDEFGTFEVADIGSFGHNDAEAPEEITFWLPCGDAHDTTIPLMKLLVRALKRMGDIDAREEKLRVRSR
jgi:hypothetical protein